MSKCMHNCVESNTALFAASIDPLVGLYRHKSCRFVCSRQSCQVVAGNRTSRSLAATKLVSEKASPNRYGCRPKHHRLGAIAHVHFLFYATVSFFLNRFELIVTATAAYLSKTRSDHLTHRSYSSLISASPGGTLPSSHTNLPSFRLFPTSRSWLRNFCVSLVEN